jgi:hypothetical protein
MCARICVYVCVCAYTYVCVYGARDPVMKVSIHPIPSSQILANIASHCMPITEFNFIVRLCRFCFRRLLLTLKLVSVAQPALYGS